MGAEGIKPIVLQGGPADGRRLDGISARATMVWLPCQVNGIPVSVDYKKTEGKLPDGAEVWAYQPRGRRS